MSAQCSTTERSLRIPDSDVEFHGRRNRQRCCTALEEKIPARLILYFLSWSGFLVSFMMRNDMNFALVAMTSNTNNAGFIANSTNFSSATNFQNEVPTVNRNGHDTSLYEWSTTVKSIILSSFYWCYVLSQVVGGIATQYFGTKKVFGWSQFTTALCSLCIPWAADVHYGLLITMRSIQGFASGLTWPAMYAIVGYWIPLEERSRFMSSFQGFSIGIGLTYPLCGYIIDNHGWRYVFLTTGSLGMFWCLAWYFLGFNTPQEHPRIKPQELKYIEDNLDVTASTKAKKEVPWWSIFRSMPAWAIAITTFGRIWIHYIFIVSGPNFMKNILKFNYQQNGFLSGMPFVFSYFSSLIFCYAADKMASAHITNLTNIRKLFTAISQVFPGILILCIGYINNITILLVTWFVAVTFITASYAGAMANIVDIAPNFAGPVLAFCQTIHMSASFLSPLAVGVIVNEETSIEQWRLVFMVAAGVSIFTYIAYQIWGTAEIQKWNQSEEMPHSLSEERQVLQNKRENKT